MLYLENVNDKFIYCYDTHIYMTHYLLLWHIILLKIESSIFFYDTLFVGYDILFYWLWQTIYCLSTTILNYEQSYLKILWHTLLLWSIMTHHSDYDKTNMSEKWQTSYRLTIIGYEQLFIDYDKTNIDYETHIWHTIYWLWHIFIDYDKLFIIMTQNLLVMTIKFTNMTQCIIKFDMHSWFQLHIYYYDWMIFIGYIFIGYDKLFIGYDKLFMIMTHHLSWWQTIYWLWQLFIVHYDIKYLLDYIGYELNYLLVMTFLFIVMTNYLLLWQTIYCCMNMNYFWLWTD